jgi:hypothetical protein
MTGSETDRREIHVSSLDTVLFVFAGISAVWLAYLVLLASLRPGWQLLLLAVFWLLVAYLVLPRLHRVMTHVYVPNYFIGRARTSDGLLADPVNIALLGTEAQLHAALDASGWTRADEVDLSSSLRIIRTTLSRRSYPEAPVSPLLLFGRQQDFAYQQEVAGNPAKRHHVRFWQCAEGWRLPGGHPADWVAAGTYDRAVGLSLMTLQVTHRIASDIDRERDHIVGSLTQHNPDARVEVIRHFSSGYHARNGGGDAMVTDGDMPVVDLRAVEPADEPALERLPAHRGRRPAPTLFGAGVAFARGVLTGAVGAMLIAVPGTNLLPGSIDTDTPVATGLSLLVFAATDVGLAVATYVGQNWSRVLLMLSSVIAITGAFSATAQGGPRPTPGAGLPTVALSILVLLALSSQRARDFAKLRRSPGTARPGRRLGGGARSAA